MKSFGKICYTVYVNKSLNQFLLYRYKFIIGYTLLTICFLVLSFWLPFHAPTGLSEAEKASVVQSYSLHFSSVISGDLVDLPYHILQKISILIFGFTPFAIKLPSILCGFTLGLLFVLLLNRWFKNNTALLASILTVLSIPFLYLSGSGTPQIMLVFWPTLLLWLGSKIQGEEHPSVPASFLFVLTLSISIYTPYLFYLVAFIVLFALLSPHLRFTLKTLPRPQLIATAILAALGVAIWLINLAANSSSAVEIFLARDFDFSVAQLSKNLRLGFAPFFSWVTPVESILLSPMFNIALVLIAIIGLFSTRKDFFASRNAIASCFLLFSLGLTALNPDSAILLILPFAILTAHGLKYLLEKWYKLFPENPYARIFALLPLSLLILTILTSTLLHYFNGYNYSPSVANHFSTDLDLVSANLPQDTSLYTEDSLDLAFYAVYQDRTHHIQLLTTFPLPLNLNSDQDTTADDNSNSPAVLAELPTTLALLHSADSKNDFDSLKAALTSRYTLNRIITSPKSEDSDRIYLYQLKNS